MTVHSTLAFKPFFAAAVAFSLLLGSAQTVSAADIAANSWTNHWDPISRAYPLANGFAVVLESDTYQGHTSSCDGGRQFYVRASDSNYDVLARTLLAAYLAGHEISVYWDTSDSCRAHINRFQVRR